MQTPGVGRQVAGLIHTSRRTGVVLIALAVVAASCGSATTETVETTAPPAEVTIDEAFLASQVAEVDVPDGGGAFMIVVVDEGGGVTSASAGIDPTGSAPSPSDTFRIGSITKTFTAALTLMLVDEGLVSLDDDASGLVTRVSVPSSVTVRDLLGHTSGIPDLVETQGFLSGLERDRERAWTPEDAVGLIAGEDVRFAPGERFGYSNTNYVILGVLIEELTGQTYAAALRERILDPLGLSDTYLAGMEEGPDPAAVFSTPGNPIEYDYTSIVTNAWSAGALVSSATDLHTFLTALLSGGLVSDEMLEAMTDTGEEGNGLGIFRRVAPADVVGHNGSLPGYETLVLYSPPTGRTAFFVATVWGVDRSPSTQAVADAIRYGSLPNS